MQRISGPDVATDLFGAGKHGYQDPVPGSTPATTVTAGALNALQEEIAQTIEGAGIVLNGASYTQLMAAITALAALKPDTVISPTAIAGTQNAWNPTSWAKASVVRMTLTGSQTINGLATDTVPKLIFNVDSADTATFAHDSASATATANRILTHTGADVGLKPGESALFWPDPTTGKWRMVAPAINLLTRGNTWTVGQTFSQDMSCKGIAATDDISTTGAFAATGSVQAGTDVIADGAGANTGRFKYHASIYRTVMVPLHYAAANGFDHLNGALVSSGANPVAFIPLTHFLRTGCKITKVRVAWDSNGAPGVAPGFTLVRRVPDKAAPASTALNTEATDGDFSGTAGTTSASPQIMSAGSGANGSLVTTTVDLSSHEWYLKVTGTNNASGDVLYWVEIIFLDPGPRND